MFKHTAFLSVFFCLTFAFAEDSRNVPVRSPQIALVAKIFSQKESSVVSCTATLVKFRKDAFSEECAFISNAHCVSNPQATYLKQFAYQSALANPIALKIKKINRRLDLVQFELNSEMTQYCNSMTWVETKKTHDFFDDRSQSFLATGFLANEVKERYSKDFSWQSGGYAPSIQKIFYSGRNSDEKLVHIEYLHVQPGMSGGYVRSNWGDFSGLIARLIPLQRNAFVIPAEIILNWLNGKSDDEGLDMLSSADPKTLVAAHYSKKHSMAGDNGHALGGDNGHALGGDNGHALGGDFISQVDERFRFEKILQLLREPDEGISTHMLSSADGIILPATPKILLGLGNEQIDGLNDWAIKPELLKSKKTLIVREKDGHLDLPLRKKMLERLDGYYKTNFVSGSADINHNILEPNVTDPEGSRLVLSGQAMADIDVDAKKNRVLLTIHSHPMTPAVERLAFIQAPADKIDFKVSMSPDAKTIYLDHGNLRLLCDNKHYLKLICSGPGVEFSISKTNTMINQVEFRLSHVRPIQSKILISYHYGRLTGTQYAKEYRKTWSD